MTILENALTMIELGYNLDELRHYESVEIDLWNQYNESENEQELTKLEKQLLSNSDKIAYHKEQITKLYNQAQNVNFTYSQMSFLLQKPKFIDLLSQAINQAKDVRNQHLRA